MMDRIFASIGVVALLAFMGIVNVYVMEPDLWVVSLVVLVGALWFIWQDLTTGGSRIEGNEDENTDG